MAKDARGRELPKGIRQRDNGTFEGRVAVDGKRVSVYGNTVTEVKKKIAETKYKMEHGIYVDQSNISFDEWFNTWLEEYKKNSVKKRYHFFIQKLLQVLFLLKLDFFIILTPLLKH